MGHLGRAKTHTMCQILFHIYDLSGQETINIGLLNPQKGAFLQHKPIFKDQRLTIESCQYIQTKLILCRRLSDVDILRDKIFGWDIHPGKSGKFQFSASLLLPGTSNMKSRS